ncbi:MAG: DUF86 domain-containing protein [Holosporales bacterium]
MTPHWIAHAVYILESIAAIEHYVKDFSDTAAALDDSKTRDAVLRRLETLALSAAKLPQEFKAHHAHIAWKSIAGFRNILAHDYLGDIDNPLLIGIINKRLPELAAALQKHGVSFAPAIPSTP